MNRNLLTLKTELETELDNILSYWMRHATDEQYGGFVGRIDHNNQPDNHADKGSVLNSRILWTFSAAYRLTKKPVYLEYAQRCYHYFVDHFIDQQYAGVYWSIDHLGNPADSKKQVYAQSFAIYALSEFYRATGMVTALQQAIDLFSVIEQHSYDTEKGGYIDAFTQQWTNMPDIRLSANDANEKKTMNTHLHMLEAYSNLFQVWPMTQLKIKIVGLLSNFFDHIIDPLTNHLILFFDENWAPKSTIVSYGHDIEAGWLLLEAARSIDDQNMVLQTKKIALSMAGAAKEGLDKDGGLWYEYEPAGHHLIKEKHWWPQAEAMVGFFNAWELGGNDAYLAAAFNSWAFIKKYIRDGTKNEWVWGILEDYSLMPGQDKAGIWKCPYHNGRACIELITRITAVVK